MSQNPYAHLPYRPCVGVMLLNSEKKVFVARRIDTKSEAWQMPQGGIDEGEDPRLAAKRELLEEIGTDKMEIIAESAEWLDYDLPEHLIGQLWKGRYRGQRQKWYLANFTGQDSDINIATKEPEFSHWQWTEPKSLPDLIVAFKRDLYLQIVQEFSPYLGK